MLQNSRGVFFLRSPKRRRQLRHRRTRLGDPKTDKQLDFQQCHFSKKISFSRLLYICKVPSCPRGLPALCVCVAAACGASATSKKTHTWIFGTCILWILWYFVILSYLEAPWDPRNTQEAPRKHPGSTQEAPRRHPGGQGHLGDRMCVFICACAQK